MKHILLLFILSVLACSCRAQTISADSVANYVGKRVTVTGTVSSEYFDQSAHGEPTFLDIDGTYPNQAFTVLIWIEDRRKFKYSLEGLKGNNIAITGVVTLYRGKPEIEVSNPKQIRQ